MCHILRCWLWDILHKCTGTHTIYLRPLPCNHSRWPHRVPWKTPGMAPARTCRSRRAVPDSSSVASEVRWHKNLPQLGGLYGTPYIASYSWGVFLLGPWGYKHPLEGGVWPILQRTVSDRSRSSTRFLRFVQDRSHRVVPGRCPGATRRRGYYPLFLCVCWVLLQVKTILHLLPPAPHRSPPPHTIFTSPGSGRWCRCSRLCSCIRCPSPSLPSSPDMPAARS